MDTYKNFREQLTKMFKNFRDKYNNNWFEGINRHKIYGSLVCWYLIAYFFGAYALWYEEISLKIFLAPVINMFYTPITKTTSIWITVSEAMAYLGIIFVVSAFILSKNIFISQLYKVLNWILNHQWKFVIGWLILAYGLGIIGYQDAVFKAIKEERYEPFLSIKPELLSIMLWSFINTVNSSTDNLINNYIVISKVMSILGLAFAVAVAFLKDRLAELKLIASKNSPHSLVIGLGENNRAYLDSEKKLGNEDSIIIIESDPQNTHIDNYKNNGFSVYIGTLDEFGINYSQLERVVASTGDDKTNLEIAGKLIDMVPKTMDKKEFGESTIVYIHLQNQDYKALFHKKILKAKNDLPLEFKIYSYNDYAARELFENHTVLGNFVELSDGSTRYHIAVIGDGNLAERIIYHLCMQTALPHRNHCTIHCISNDADQFIKNVHAKFTGIGQIDWITLKGHSTLYNSVDFYSLPLWHTHFLTNVIVCDDDEKNNLEITVNLHDKVYLKEAVGGKLKTKVHFALYHNFELAKAISRDKECEYKQFFAFGDAGSICSREHFIDEIYENIAKLIHKGYGERYVPDHLSDFDNKETLDEINEKWHDTTTFSDRESNSSQALHINSKLMSMGFNKIRSSESSENLLSKNSAALRHYFDDFFQETMNVDTLKHASCQLALDYVGIKPNEDPLSDLFSKIVNGKSLVSKLVKTEHERWNAFHYLNGWSYATDKSKNIKEHNCLIPLEKFDDYKRKKTVLFDLYSILYLPNYLASTGYEIVPIDFMANENKCEKKECTLGITGHRDIDGNYQEVKSKLEIELKKIIDHHDKITLVSPLAEGSDRLFVHTAIEAGADKIKKMLVIMPFEKDKYIKDFKTDASKDEFLAMTPQDGVKQYKGIGVECKVIPCSTGKEDGYLKAGQSTVSKSDVLFAIWDGLPANGTGGTAEIIEFAKDLKKNIVIINPTNYEVSYFPQRTVDA